MRLRSWVELENVEYHRVPISVFVSWFVTLSRRFTLQFLSSKTLTCWCYFWTSWQQGKLMSESTVFRLLRTSLTKKVAKILYDCFLAISVRCRQYISFILWQWSKTLLSPWNTYSQISKIKILFVPCFSPNVKRVMSLFCYFS